MKKSITVIGAADISSSQYAAELAVSVGEKLVEIARDLKYNIQTGGVSGVGVYTYAGVIQAYLKLNPFYKETDDIFRVIIPNFVSYSYFNTEKMKHAVETVPYDPPESYYALASILGLDLEVLKEGKDMAERREILASKTDIAVMINGGLGTLDEAVNIANNKKPVVVMANSGGVATILDIIINEKPHIMGSEMYWKVQRFLGGTEDDVDYSHFHIVHNVDDMTNKIRELV